MMKQALELTGRAANVRNLGVKRITASVSNLVCLVDLIANVLFARMDNLVVDIRLRIRVGLRGLLILIWMMKLYTLKRNRK